MTEVFQDQPLTMQWCLDCHNQPEQHLRAPEKVTVMGYSVPNQLDEGRKLAEQYNINPPTDCSTCHR